MKKVLVLFLMSFFGLVSQLNAQDPNVSVYIANSQYMSGNVFRFDVMVQAVGATSSFRLRTFQAGIYINPTWLNGGTPVCQTISSALTTPGYNGSIQWNATDRLINLSVNTNVRTLTGCISTLTGTTPVRVATIELTNTATFSTCTSPDLKFNYVQNLSPLRLRTSVSWREGATGCSNNYDLFYPNRSFTGQMFFNGELYTTTDADGRSPSSISGNLSFCFSTLNLTAFLQGYYIPGSNTMQSVLMNQSVANASVDQSDTITVEFRSATDPALIIASDKTILNVNGSALVTFAAGLSGQSVYLVIKHRNSIETWSASPVTLSTSLNYNFTTSSSQAFGSNMIEVDPNVWAFYSGDMNQDGYVDASDYPLFDIDNLNGLSNVYSNTDLNGDGYVDASDYPLFDINNVSGISLITP